MCSPLPSLTDITYPALSLCSVSIKRTSDREYALRQQVWTLVVCVTLINISVCVCVCVQVRPLDPANMRKLHNIRKLFLEVDQKIG